MRKVRKAKFKDYVEVSGKLTTVANDVEFDGQFVVINQGLTLVPLHNVAYMEMVPELKLIKTDEDKVNESNLTSNPPRTGKKKT